jgi:beta-ureidopropionase
MSQTYKLAGIQLAGTPDLERNLRRANEMIGLAATHGAKLAILPELWAYPWFVDTVQDEAKSLAQPIDGPLITALSAKAAENEMILVVPFFEHDEASGANYNTAAVIGEDGKLIGRYRKVHVPRLPGWEESHYFAASNEGFPVFETSVGKLGVQMGWDLLFPEGIRALAVGGAEIIAAPMAVTGSNSDLWQNAAVAAAFCNGVWICRVGRVGHEQDIAFAGNSCCALPTGDLLDAPASDIEGVTLWEFDPRLIPLVRRDWPLLGGRRPDQYGALTKQSAATGEAKT